MRFAKIVFLVAGIYGFLGVGLAWQALFLVLSSDPLRYRPMIVPSILEKIGYGLALIVLYSQHRVALSTLAIGSGDWIFAFLFLTAYFKTKSGGALD